MFVVIRVFVIIAMISIIQAETTKDYAAVKISFANIVKKASPAVVSIQVTQDSQHEFGHFFDDGFMDFFFGHSFKGRPRRKILEKSLGSGVIIAENGLVITCYHVIDNASDIKIKLSDNREYDVKLLVSDRANDLALLQVVSKKPVKLPYIEIQRKLNLDVGDIVLAIGNPFGVGQSVTMGIVSAAYRVVNNRLVFQTDAAVNPGNSGGALIDYEGKLIGIPNAILSRTGASHGIGFALTAKLIDAMLEAMDNGGVVVRPWTGAIAQSVTKEMAASMKMPEIRGVIITKLLEQSSLEKAGIKQGDIITKLNGFEVVDDEDFQVYFQTLPINQDVDVHVISNSKQNIIKVKPTKPPLLPAPDTTELKGRHPLAGVIVENLSPAKTREYGMDPNRKGVVIAKAAARNMFAEFKPGDRIVSLNGEEIDSVKQLVQILAEPMRSFNLIVDRKGQKMTLMFR